MASRGTERSWGWVRWTGWGGAALLILAALAMPSTREAWTVGDYVFASLLIGGVGLALELAVRISPRGAVR